MKHRFPLQEITNLITDFIELLYLLGYDSKSSAMENLNIIHEFMKDDTEIYDFISDDYVEQVSTLVYKTKNDLDNFNRKVHELNV